MPTVKHFSKIISNCGSKCTDISFPTHREDGAQMMKIQRA